MLFIIISCRSFRLLLLFKYTNVSSLFSLNSSCHSKGGHNLLKDSEFQLPSGTYHFCPWVCHVIVLHKMSIAFNDRASISWNLEGLAYSEFLCVKIPPDGPGCLSQNFQPNFLFLASRSLP